MMMMISGKSVCLKLIYHSWMRSEPDTVFPPPCSGTFSPLNQFCHLGCLWAITQDFLRLKMLLCIMSVTEVFSCQHITYPIFPYVELWLKTSCCVSPNASVLCLWHTNYIGGGGLLCLWTPDELPQKLKCVRTGVGKMFPLRFRLIGGSDYKLIYRHYATLYFVFCVDSSESELGILDLIQVKVVGKIMVCLLPCFAVLCRWFS